MAIRKILTFPDPILQRVAEPISEFDVGLAKVISDMVETMRHAPGIGLAAPQIGISKRLMIVEIPPDLEDSPEGGSARLYAICNPEITRREGHARIEEGCLSFPGFYLEVDRAYEITIEGQNADGTPFRLDAEGLLSICFQHELDHLEGKLLIDHASKKDRKRYLDELEKKRSKAPGRVEDRRPAL